MMGCIVDVELFALFLFYLTFSLNLCFSRSPPCSQWMCNIITWSFVQHWQETNEWVNEKKAGQMKWFLWDPCSTLVMTLWNCKLPFLGVLLFFLSFFFLNSFCAIFSFFSSVWTCGTCIKWATFAPCFVLLPTGILSSRRLSALAINWRLQARVWPDHTLKSVYAHT